LINNDRLHEIINLENIKRYTKSFLTEGNPICNHVYVVDKAAFIGPDVEYHQEFFNINTYAPGYSADKNLDNFLQLFIALDDHTLENGPLYVFKGSHKEGLLDHEDMISPNLKHKRRVTYRELHRISNKYPLEPVLLKKGDALFFNHLIVHGSPTNCSRLRRRAFLLQFRIDSLKKDNKLFEEEENYRSQYVINECSNIQDKLSNSSIYRSSFEGNNDQKS